MTTTEKDKEAVKNTENAPKKQSNGNVQELNLLRVELEKQRTINAEMEARMEILFKSIDHNKIRQNTPKKHQLPIIKVSLWNDEVVVGWTKMTQNKVHLNNNGIVVEQRSVYILASGEKIELDFDTFHQNKEIYEVQATKVEDKRLPNGTEDTFYHFTYKGKEHAVSKLFIG